MTPHPNDPPRIEFTLSAADVHLLLYAGWAVIIIVAVAACAVPVLDAVRRWVAR